jgi:predicted RNA methylase
MVNHTSYVIDIGTGSGILAMLSAQAGARRVTAIDMNSNSIKYARKAALLNGFDGKIEFLDTHYEKFQPIEYADVVICEMLSSMMLIEQQIHACSHSVKHFLKRDGVILPQQVSIYVVPVESSELWQRFEIGGLDFPKVPQTVDSTQYSDFAELSKIHVFDLSVENLEKVNERVRFKVFETGIIHGLVGMFVCVLIDDIILKMEDGWRELFIPLEKPINVKQGDEVVFNIEYTPGKYDTLHIQTEI